MFETTLTPVGDDKVIGSWRSVAPDGRRRQRFQVVTFRAGKIIDMQDCSSRRQAGRVARGPLAA